MRATAPLWGLAAVLPLIVCNILQAAALVIAPFSRSAFHRVSFLAATGVWLSWSFIVERLHGTRIIVEGDAVPRGESAVIFANHQSMADVVAMLAFAYRCGRMSDMRWIVKDSMRLVPFLGWAMLSLDFLFLKRDWAKDRERIQISFARFRARRQPLWLLLFPEGTRRTPEKQAISLERARRRNLPQTALVMSPRTKGFVASLQGLAGKVEAVYRVAIFYPLGAPKVYRLFLGEVPEIRLMLKRFPIAELPVDEVALAEWLQQSFAEMDAQLASATAASGGR